MRIGELKERFPKAMTYRELIEALEGIGHQIDKPVIFRRVLPMGNEDIEISDIDIDESGILFLTSKEVTHGQRKTP